MVFCNDDDYRSLINLCRNEEEKVFILELLNSLKKDVNGTLMVENIRVIKISENLKIFLLRKKSINIFFTLKNENKDIYIIYFESKNNKIDFTIIKKRLQEILNK